MRTPCARRTVYPFGKVAVVCTLSNNKTIPHNCGQSGHRLRVGDIHVHQSSAKRVTRVHSYVFSSFLGSFPLSFFLTFAIILQGPLTQNVKRSLNITNPNADPVSFKVKVKVKAVKVRPSRIQDLARLICISSCTTYGPFAEKSTLARRLKSKVQYIF